MRELLFILLVFASKAIALSQPLKNSGGNNAKLEVPELNSTDIVIAHTGFTLSYNKTHKQPNWVAYELTKGKTNKIFKRANKFLPDPSISKENMATDKDYAHSGYDKGHLAPAADMSWSLSAMKESFYYSNVSPQLPAFNRGVWKKSEELVRTWAIENNIIYIVTGPVLKSTLAHIGANKITVPQYYYKVILDYSPPSIKGIGFIIPNAGSQNTLQSFAVSIDSVEKLTGINFFPSLTDEDEKLIEKALCITCWTWQTTKKLPALILCKGVTKNGRPCKKKTTNRKGYCYIHQKNG